MAERILFEKSEELLVKFFNSLNERERKSIGLMGGWAVHHILKSRGIAHMGSRDIDIFFDPKAVKPGLLREKLSKMGFHPHSTFRWAKIFHSENEKELGIEESKKYPLYDLSYVYFDVAAPSKAGHSMPEPILEKVLKKENMLVKINGVGIMVPTPKAIVEMKLKSAVSRTDPFKRSKDLADLYALLENSPELWEIKGGARTGTKLVDKKPIKKFRKSLQRFRIDGSIAAASSMLGADQGKITSLFEKL